MSGFEEMFVLIDDLSKLKGVKLVIGNGFDLYCKLETSYPNFFHVIKKENERIFNAIDDYKNGLIKRNENYKHNPDFCNPPRPFYGFGDGVIDTENNIWNVLFIILRLSDYPVRNEWSEIEKIMTSSLKDDYVSKEGFHDIPSFKYIYDTFDTILDDYHSGKKYDVNNTFILTAFINQKRRTQNFKDKEEFYSWVLSQLNEFELRFGKYIKKVHDDNQDIFVERSKTLINQLCDPSSLTSIYTFNYDDYRLKDICKNLVHINGDTSNPIFGINSEGVMSDDPSFKFTKVSRQKNLKNEIDEEVRKIPFRYLVIFGHSLDEADYDYFFSEFDKLKILEHCNSLKIVFAYNVYDKEKKLEINNEYRTDVSKLLKKYITSRRNQLPEAENIEHYWENHPIILCEVK